MAAPLVFLSSDPISIPCLEGCLRLDASLVGAVVTAPDRPRGRGQRLLPNEVARFAGEAGVPLYQPDVPEAGLFRELAGAGIRVGVVFSYGKILRQAVLDALPGGFVNLHASPLPRLRGASPIETAIALGWTETAITLMKVVRRMDAGPMGPRLAVPIHAEDSGGDLRGKVSAGAADLLLASLDAVLGDRVRWEEQDETAATYCRRLSKGDGALDFRVGAEALANRVRALTPSPGVYIDYGPTRIRLRGPRLLAVDPEDTGWPGTVLGLVEETLAFRCGPGVLGFAEAQRPGGRWLPAVDFLRGFDLPRGEVIESACHSPLETVSP